MKVLVSNTAIPSNRIGSWVTRINSLVRNHDCFDYILSPSKASPKNINCWKGKFITYHKWLRKWVLLHWVARDYLRALKNLSEKYDEITVIVMDDPHLVEAIVLKRDMMKSNMKIIFSFHGFRLNLRQEIVDGIDKVLFLSEAGRDESIENYVRFRPETEVVWNGVDSSLFYPLEDMKRETMRYEIGLSNDQIVLLWMANDRPMKGFQIFSEAVLKLLPKYDQLRVITIGTKQRIDHPAVINVGRLRHEYIPKYLQMGDIYLFTSLYEEGFGLSMVEALKCGNLVIASDRGAVSNVLDGLPGCYLVETPQKVENWLEVTEKVILGFHRNTLTTEEADKIWNYENWEKLYLKAIS